MGRVARAGRVDDVGDVDYGVVDLYSLAINVCKRIVYGWLTG
jgi:hypothetical protein